MHYQAKAPNQHHEILCTRDLIPIRPIADELKNRPIVIAIAVHDQGKSLTKALESALTQTAVTQRKACILLLDDHSSDDWLTRNSKLLESSDVAIIRGRCGSPARARNALLDYVDEHFSARWVCRLDADDYLANDKSVEALCEAGDRSGARYVLGSNRLSLDGCLLPEINEADPAVLQDRQKLAEFIHGFCLHGSTQELPSCNLVLATHSGFRYPNMRGAEDHWLVAELLTFHPKMGHIQPQPLYAVYSLTGAETVNNQNTGDWKDQRQRLAFAVSCWETLFRQGAEVLGAGHEGVVWKENQVVLKRFYPWAMSEAHVTRLTGLLSEESVHIPSPRWFYKDATWHCASSFKQLRPMGKFTNKLVIVRFLSHLYRRRLAALNLKRDNLMITDTEELVLIDIGKDIVELTVSCFLDMSARLFAIAILGWPDDELVRRRSALVAHEALAAIPGFNEFYLELIHSLHPLIKLPDSSSKEISTAPDTSLLIKACAQDLVCLASQVKHIVSQLSYPQKFHEVLLLIDSHPGPFLRQYEHADLDAVITIGETLTKDGWVDRVIISPQNLEEIRTLYLRWFGSNSIEQTHTSGNAPLFSQLWAFEQITTRFVLQCDCDVLIGRKDFEHDYLKDMRAALTCPDVLSVGFNIPKAIDGFRPYEASPGNYVPEVRMGLLDLDRIHQVLPISNPVEGEQYRLTWHRAIHEYQRQRELRSLRGGDSRTFYVHPLNQHKFMLPLSKLRDLISQGRYPVEQHEQFDLIPGEHWRYPERTEDIVFLLKGCNTSEPLIRRCLNSLKGQTNQDFGLVVIDDDSNPACAWRWPSWLGTLFPRTTLIRRPDSAGRIPNFIEAIEHICRDPDCLIVILDQDDALMDMDLVVKLRQQVALGHDLIQTPMFRPDKPLQQYHPDYNQSRNSGGAEVWAHLRAFKKSLFERVPKSYFQHDGKWVEQVTDYATMLPMAEMAKAPVFIDGCYGYYHQRQPYSQTVKQRQNVILAHLLSLPSLSNTAADIKPDT